MIHFAMDIGYVVPLAIAVIFLSGVFVGVLAMALLQMAGKVRRGE